MTPQEIRSLLTDYMIKRPLGVPVEGLQQVALQENLEQEAYQDSLGNWTIGVGHTPSYQGEYWSIDKCLSVFWVDITTKGVTPISTVFPWARGKMSDIRWWVFVNMAFNMGIGNFLNFHNTINAAQNGDWEACAEGMRDSIWYHQVGQRGVELVQQMLTNKWVLP